eukprot:sb/3478840/
MTMISVGTECFNKENNGFVWVGPHFVPDQPIEVVSMTLRETIARLVNVIKALIAYGVQLFDTIILTGYDISLKYKLNNNLTLALFLVKVTISLLLSP